MSDKEAQVTEKSNLVMSNWDSHVWKADTVYKLTTSSPKTIMLEAIGGTKRATASVHIDLLCHFSPHCCGFLEASRLDCGTSLKIDTDKETLDSVIFWLYSGLIPAIPDAKSQNIHTRRDRLLRLYVFASDYDFLALRREVMSQWVSFDEERQATSPQAAFLTIHLPMSSPMFEYLLDFAALHKNYEHDSPAQKAEREMAPKEFLYAVLERQSREKWGSGQSSRCTCCHGVCHYHEHESKEEREATCGKQHTGRRMRILAMPPAALGTLAGSAAPAAAPTSAPSSGCIFM